MEKSGDAPIPGQAEVSTAASAPVVEKKHSRLGFLRSILRRKPKEPSVIEQSVHVVTVHEPYKIPTRNEIKEMEKIIKPVGFDSSLVDWEKVLNRLKRDPGYRELDTRVAATEEDIPPVIVERLIGAFNAALARLKVK